MAGIVQLCSFGRFVSNHVFFVLVGGREFGPKVLTLKLLLKQVPVILDDRDKNVREEGKKLVVELHRWIGAALKPQLTALKPIQVHPDSCLIFFDVASEMNRSVVAPQFFQAMKKE